MDRAALHASILARTELEFVRSSGPGGQNVNKVSSKARARVRIVELAGLSIEERMLASARLASRLTEDGALVVSVQTEREQSRNRALALERLEHLIVAAALPEAPRRPTRPSRAARERRLDRKRVQSNRKRLRGESHRRFTEE